MRKVELDILCEKKKKEKKISPQKFKNSHNS